MDSLQSSSTFIQGIIYLAICTVNKKKYIGQTYRASITDPSKLLYDRKKRHVREANKGYNYPFHCALRLYGEEGFEWMILHVCLDKDELNKKETEAIIQYQSSVEQHGYNALLESPVRTFGPQMRERMSQSAKRRWNDPEKRRVLERCIKQGRAATIERSRKIWAESGRRILTNPEVRKKAVESIRRTLRSDVYRQERSRLSKQHWANLDSEARANRIKKFKSAENKRKTNHAKAMQSPDYKAKVSALIKERWSRSFIVYDTKTGDTIKQFTNIIDAANEFDVCASSISACLRGKARTFGNRKYKARWLESPQSRT